MLSKAPIFFLNISCFPFRGKPKVSSMFFEIITEICGGNMRGRVAENYVLNFNLNVGSYWPHSDVLWIRNIKLLMLTIWFYIESEHENHCENHLNCSTKKATQSQSAKRPTVSGYILFTNLSSISYASLLFFSVLTKIKEKQIYRAQKYFLFYENRLDSFSNEVIASFL